MKRAFTGAILTFCAGSLGSAQSGEAPQKFEAADVHPSVKVSAAAAFPRIGPVRNGRYEIRNATMLNLVGIAYGFAADKVVGGPNWLELDRFDLIAKVPPGWTLENGKQMLQALLEDRFKLVLHKETKPLPAFALTTGKSPKLKEATGSEEAGCHPAQAGRTPGEGGRLNMTLNGGPPMAIALGPGMTIQYQCRNVTMAAFASNLRGMVGGNLGPNEVVDETGIKGAFNFDLSYSLSFVGPAAGESGERISLHAALEKLGLKLEERQVPTPVIVVDSLNRKPSENPPGTAEALPSIALPTEFEVASLKPSDPNMRMGGFRIQPGGRLISEGMPLRFLIVRAFNTLSDEAIVGLPPFVMDRYDVIAKVPAGLGMADMDAIAPMMLALLKDRFKLQYHTEERQVQAYSLVAVKPKLKKADPNSRIRCRNGGGQPPQPPGSRTLTCQNVTMAEFAEHLQNLGPGMAWPVLDATGLEGSWDLSVTFSPRAMMEGILPPRTADGNPAGGAVPTASEPTGGYTLSEALEKELGLKLEKSKRQVSVIVIDHLERTPTEN